MDNCIFCKIIAGGIPSSVIYEDEDLKVIMDIYPLQGAMQCITKNILKIF